MAYNREEAKKEGSVRINEQPEIKIKSGGREGLRRRRGNGDILGDMHT